MSRTDDKYLKQLQIRYRKASKKERTAILDEFVKTTGYHRKHATAVLNGRRERVQGPIRRPRGKVYGADRNVSSIVRQLWTEFREHILAPWAVGSVDSRRTRLPTLSTVPTTATAR